MSSTHRKKAARALSAQIGVSYQQALNMIIHRQGSDVLLPHRHDTGVLVVCRGVSSSAAAAVALGFAAGCQGGTPKQGGNSHTALVDFDSAGAAVSRALTRYMPSLVNAWDAWKAGEGDFVTPSRHYVGQIGVDVLPPPLRVRDRDALPDEFVVALLDQVVRAYGVGIIVAPEDLDDGILGLMLARAGIVLHGEENRVIALLRDGDPEADLEVPGFATNAAAADGQGDLLSFLASPQMQRVFDALVRALSSALPAQILAPAPEPSPGLYGPQNGLLSPSPGLVPAPALEREDFLARLQAELPHGRLSGLIAVAGGDAETRRMLCDDLAAQLPQGTALMEPSLLAAFGGDAQSYLRNVLHEVRVRAYLRPRFLPLDLSDPRLGPEDIAMLSRCLTACLHMREAATPGPPDFQVDLWQPTEAEALPWLLREEPWHR